ncbi:MAG: arginyltransferase [Sandaracinaceae bacterium]
MRQRWSRAEPPELVVHDAPSECAYLDGQLATLPMRLPARALSPTELDARLAAGDRRHGPFLYRPTCEACRACEAIRIPVAELTSKRAHRRILKRGDGILRAELGRPIVDAARLALYEKHKVERDLAIDSTTRLDARAYQAFLVDTCAHSYELRLFDGTHLVAVSIFDRGATAMSAVYCLWDPDYADLSVGTYAVLKQVELCRAWGITHLYLGLYVANNAHMSYKARFLPNERLIDGVWTRFDR